MEAAEKSIRRRNSGVEARVDIVQLYELFWRGSLVVLCKLRKGCFENVNFTVPSPSGEG